MESKIVLDTSEDKDRCIHVGTTTITSKVYGTLSTEASSRVIYARSSKEAMAEWIGERYGEAEKHFCLTMPIEEYMNHFTSKVIKSFVADFAKALVDEYESGKVGKDVCILKGLMDRTTMEHVRAYDVYHTIARLIDVHALAPVDLCKKDENGRIDSEEIEHLEDLIKAYER